jgi:seryl-tRNA synthetase
MENRDELLAKLQKKIKGKRRGGRGGKAAIDYNKLQQLTESFQSNSGELEALKKENKQLKDSLKMLMNPNMKEALENYEQVLAENKKLKEQLELS